MCINMLKENQISLKIRIFTLRCIHNDLIPVSIKLKSTLKSARANRILRKAEKDLLQTRVKSINYILDKTAQQLEECRSKLATIISTQKLRECQDFVDKLGEIRFNKVKLRQLYKFNLLTIRKEGNITRSNNTNTNNLASLDQTNSQVNPPYQGRNHSFPGKYPPSGHCHHPWGRNYSFPGKYPPPRKASASPATASPQVTALPPLWEGSNSSQAVPPSHSLRSTQAGQVSNPTRASRQGNRCPPNHMSTQASQEVNTTFWEGNTSTPLQ